MSTQPTITFNDGKTIPQVGLGVWQTANEIAAPSVRAAIAAGYRHVDTAAIYNNEDGVGEGIRTSGVSRGDIFLTTKLWNDAQGYGSTLKAFDESLKRLGTDYVDLYLIHWPSAHRGLYLDSWKAFLRLKEEGRARSIGVSNFGEAHLKRIIDGYGRPSDLDLLLDVADNISPGLTWPPRQTTICVLGPSATAPLASALKLFRNEFEHYIEHGRSVVDEIGVEVASV